jgi:hypothetical protein
MARHGTPTQREGHSALRAGTLPAMLKPPSLPAGARRILELAKHDRAAARDALAALPIDEQVALICESPVRRRAELLALVSAPEEVIPRIPPAELCFVAKAVGLSDAGWLLEHASEEQIATAIDLDAWSALVPDRSRLDEWLAALRDAGDETLLRAAHGLDFELLVLALRARLSVFQGGKEDDWETPPGSLTIDGQFHLVPTRSGDDLEDVIGLLSALFSRDYWFYHRLLQAVSIDLESETEESALRWRSGRLQDLGFPPLEDAKRIYSFVRKEQLAKLPSEPRTLEVGEWPLPVWLPSLPAAGDTQHLLFRAMAALGEEERRPLLFAFLALANRVAVADEMPLGDAETLPAATEKAARVASLGLSHLARENAVEPAFLLRRVPLERLFVVGANLEGRAMVRSRTDEGPAEATPPRAPTDPSDPNRL